MKLHPRLLAALIAALALTLGAAACGDDDGGDETDTTIPEVTIPSDTTTAPATTPETTTTTEDDGGRNGGIPTVDPDAEDSPSNDKPPAPGSPEEAFEQDCEANPGKCG